MGTVTNGMYMKRFANGLKNYQMVTTENNIIAFKLVTSTTRFIYNEQLKTLSNFQKYDQPKSE